VLATAGAIRFLFFRTAIRTPKWQIVVPVLALVLVLYTIYKNVVGVDAPYSSFPYIVAGWLVIGLLLTLRRGVADRVRVALQRTQDDAPGAEPAAESGPGSASGRAGTEAMTER
jgi:hypothetical protein